MMKNGVKIFIRLKCIDIGGGDDDSVEATLGLSL